METKKLPKQWGPAENTPAGISGLKARGHGCLLGAQDAVIEVTRTENTACLTLVQAKDDADGVRLGYRFETAELGRDSDGDPITTRVVYEEDASVGGTLGQMSRFVPASGRVALELLERTTIDSGEPAPPSANIPPNVRVVRSDTWRDYCYRGQITSSAEPDAKRKAFQRASKVLQQSSLIGCWDGWVWCASKSTSSGGAPGTRDGTGTP